MTQKTFAPIGVSVHTWFKSQYSSVTTKLGDPAPAAAAILADLGEPRLHCVVHFEDGQEDISLPSENAPVDKIEEIAADQLAKAWTLRIGGDV